MFTHCRSPKAPTTSAVVLRRAIAWLHENIVTTMTWPPFPDRGYRVAGIRSRCTVKQLQWLRSRSGVLVLLIVQEHDL